MRYDAIRDDSGPRDLFRLPIIALISLVGFRMLFYYYKFFLHRQ